MTQLEAEGLVISIPAIEGVAFCCCDYAILVAYHLDGLLWKEVGHSEEVSGPGLHPGLQVMDLGCWWFGWLCVCLSVLLSGGAASWALGAVWVETWRRRKKKEKFKVLTSPNATEERLVERLGTRRGWNFTPVGAGVAVEIGWR